MAESTAIMNEAKNKYLQMNEELRKEEDRIEKAKRFHTYKGGRALFSKQKSSEKFKSNKLSVGSINESMKGSHGRQPSMQSVDTLNALETLKKKLLKKFENNHVLPKKHCTNIEPPLDQRYVSQFHLRNVSPLEHRLNDPLNQCVEMDKYVPQRFHLMTKESFKCPNKGCNKYVCKPTLRGRQANYDKRTAVLDYLPRINIRLKSGNLMTTSKSEIIVMVQNRHLFEAKFKFDASVNENLQNDLYSTAKVSCSDKYFEIDPADIHIKGGKQKDEMRDNGDYVKGKEAGICVSVTPKHYSTGPRNVKFSILCVFETKMHIKEDKNEKEKDSLKKDKENNKDDNKQLVGVELPYILDFDLGLAKTPSVDMSMTTSKAPTTATSTITKETVSKPQHRSRKSNENVPATSG